MDLLLLHKVLTVITMTFILFILLSRLNVPFNAIFILLYAYQSFYQNLFIEPKQIVLP